MERTLVALLLLGACAEPRELPPAPPADTLLARIAATPESGEVTLVRMTADADRYAFEPGELTIRSGDVVRFVLAHPHPESVAFDTAGLPPAAAAFLREQGLLHGTLLTNAGQVYEASFRDAPPGRYLFRSTPHAPSGMRGAVVVEPPR